MERDTKEKLLCAARRVIATKGYHDAKIDDIVVAAGLGKGTFYLHFEDKREVFAELVDGIFRRLRAAILNVDVRADVAAQVRHNIRALLALFQEEPELVRLLLSYAEGLDPSFEKKIRSFYSAVEDFFVESLTFGQQHHLVAPGDPRLYARLTIGALKEIVRSDTLQGNPRSREKLVEAIFGFLRTGFLRVPATTSGSRASAASARPRRSRPATGSRSRARRRRGR